MHHIEMAQSTGLKYIDKKDYDRQYHQLNREREKRRTILVEGSTSCNTSVNTTEETGIIID